MWDETVTHLGPTVETHVLTLAGFATNRISVLADFGAPQWIAGVYLGVGGGALAFILWVLALQRATPTQVANTMTLNPIAAALLATQLVDEPITLNLVAGVIAVCLGIWIATTDGKTKYAIWRNPVFSRPRSTSAISFSSPSAPDIAGNSAADTDMPNRLTGKR